MPNTGSYWSRFAQGRLSRRRALTGAAGLGIGAAALSLVGCGGGGDGGGGSGGGASTQDEGTPKPGGIWKQATITLPTHFSPFHPGADPSFANTWRRETGYYDRLWATREVPDPTRQRYGRLAASWEVVGDTIVNVKLNPAKFHSIPGNQYATGRDLTAEDVVKTVEFLKVPPASGGSFIQSGKDLKSVTAVDNLTLRFEMHGPRAFFFERMNVLVPPKEMLDEQILKTHPPVGTGPFMYKEHRQNSSEDVVRNPNYFVKDRPYLAGKSLVFLGDAAAIEAAFRANQIDDTPENWPNKLTAETVAKDMGSKIKNYTYPSTSGMAMLVNIHREPFKDIRVREAIYRAIDIDRIINVVFLGDGEKTWYFSNARTERFPVGRKAVEQYVGYDPKKAADLLRASGADLSKTYELMVPPEAQTWVDGGGLVAEDLQKVGFKLRVNPVVRNIYLQRAGPKPGDFDITMTVFLDYQYMRTNSGTFWDNTSLEDPEVDALVDKIEATIDDQARAKLSNEVEIMLAKKYSPLIPMLSTNLHGSYFAYMKGINFEGSRSGQGSWQIDRWKDQA
ncbi:MAG TPA: ABC transporter substrate-binding protein [Dehalococcoidia bacterium]|nr:ABC transporter substrate-binding protein [Dehalococcoidia bacterium]